MYSGFEAHSQFQKHQHLKIAAPAGIRIGALVLQLTAIPLCRGVLRFAPHAITTIKNCACSGDILAQEGGRRDTEIRGRLAPLRPKPPRSGDPAARRHEASFGTQRHFLGGSLTDLAVLLWRTLKLIRCITESFHLVLHTSPNSHHQSETLGYWKTLDEDYHWHIEILPVLESKAKSYTFKEVYYSPVTSETAVKRLREAKI
jgi:hypothetical protein